MTLLTLCSNFASCKTQGHCVKSQKSSIFLHLQYFDNGSYIHKVTQPRSRNLVKCRGRCDQGNKASAEISVAKQDDYSFISKIFWHTEDDKN